MNAEFARECAEAVEELFEKADGGAAGVSRTLTARGYEVNRQAVHQWKGKRVPEYYVRALSEDYRMPLKRLRPDLYDFSRPPPVPVPREAVRP